MKHQFIKAAKNGKVVKSQTFMTEKGTYEITLVRHGEHIYFYKLLNGKIVECCDLNEVR